MSHVGWVAMLARRPTVLEEFLAGQAIQEGAEGRCEG